MCPSFIDRWGRTWYDMVQNGMIGKEGEVGVKIVCVKCGAAIEDENKWLLSISNWANLYLYKCWEAYLCPECKEVVMLAIANLGIILRYSGE